MVYIGVSSYFLSDYVVLGTVIQEVPVGTGSHSAVSKFGKIRSISDRCVIQSVITPLSPPARSVIGDHKTKPTFSTTTNMATSSPFTPHLDTNYAPTEDEAAFLKRLIQAQTAEAAALTAQIAAAEAALEEAMRDRQAALSALKAEHTTLSKSIEAHTNLLSPIRRIPQDVLSLIFIFCAEDEDERPLQFWGLGAHARRPSISVLLSHVSMDWRYTALETPDLWSLLDITIPDIARIVWSIDAEYGRWARYIEQEKRRIQIFTHRSSNRPIKLKLKNGETDVELQNDETYGEAARALYRSLVDAIRASSSRWKDVELSLTFDPITESLVRLFDHAPHATPLLRNISVDLPLSRYHQPSTPTLNRITNMTSSGIFAAPSLRSVTITGGVWGNIARAKASSEWPIYHNVTHLRLHANITGELSSFGTHHALQLLKALPHLVECQLNLAHSPGAFPHPAEEPPIPLPTLTTLTLTSFPPARGFAPSLDAPNLETLHLRSDHVYPTVLPQDEAANGIVELLERFGPQLKGVTLYYESLARSAVRRSLRLLPCVERLQLSSISSEETLRHSRYASIAALSELGEHGACPDLKSLYIDIRDTEVGGMDGRLVEFLAKKRAPRGGGEAMTPPLSHVCVTSRGCSPSRDIIEKLRELDVDLQGFNLTIA